MKSFYSIIRYVNNPLSKENIAIGLLVLSGKKIYYRFSPNKINFVSKINPDNFKLFEYTFHKIENFINTEIKYNHFLLDNDIELKKNYLSRLSIYNNGFVQFDNPVAINIEFDDTSFINFFNKYIELNQKKTPKKVVNKHFQHVIQRVFSEPLKDIIDINVKIKKEQIPGLYFDYRLDGIGVKDVIYSVKSIDLNSEKPIDTIKKEIAEFESLNYRIDRFSCDNLFSQALSKDVNKHYLVVDEYSGHRDTYRQLYEILKEQNKFESPYKVIGTEELKGVTSKIISPKAKKFTEFLEY